MTGCFVGFAGTVALVREAARALGAGPEEAVSLVAALCLGIALSTLVLSLASRQPIVTAYPTAGAALLASSAGYDLPQAAGAALLAALLVILTGLIRPLQTLVRQIPIPIASAMLAGVLLRFPTQAMQGLGHEALLVAPALLAYAGLRLIRPILAVPASLATAILVAVLADRVAPGCCAVTAPAAPVLHWPQITPQSALGLALPLYLVAMASQYLPGLAVLAGDGYHPRLRPIFLATGVASALAAPTGAHGVALAAVSAALCTGPEADPDPSRRWAAGLAWGLAYLLLTLLVAPVMALLDALPPEAVLTVTGLALLGPLTAALGRAAAEPALLGAAVVTFVVTASGLTLAGVGGAFWGLMAGLVLWRVQLWRAAAAEEKARA